MITSTANDRVKWARSLQSKRRARESERAFVAEGTRWAREFLEAGIAPRLVFHGEHLSSRDRGLVNQLASLGAEIAEVSQAVMEAISDTEAPQDILVVANIPDLPTPVTRTLVVVADRLRDPGNLGTLLRTALAAEVDQVVLTKGTVDPYNPKVVRGAMGAHLHLPIRQCQPADLDRQLEGLSVRLADPARGRPYSQLDWRLPCALIIGGEAHGAQDITRTVASELIHIPISSTSDSLNAAIAAAVILFEIRRQRGTI